MGKDRYLVAHTSDTLLLGDMANCKLSEVCVCVFVCVCGRGRWYGGAVTCHLGTFSARWLGMELVETKSSISKTKT